MEVINENNYLEYILLAVDGELDVNQLKVLHQYLSVNDMAKSNYDALMATKILPESTIKFERKLDLLAIANTNLQPKTTINKRVYIWAASLACLLFTGIMYYMNVAVKSTIVRPVAAISTESRNLNKEKDTIVDAINNNVHSTRILKKEIQDIVKHKSLITPDKALNINNMISKEHIKTALIVKEQIISEQYLNIEPITIAKANPDYLMQAKSIDHQPLKIIETNRDILSLVSNTPKISYLANHKTFNVVKKITQEFADLSSDFKNIKDSGMAIVINMPQFLNRKNN
jgi:hypothetical protein